MSFASENVIATTFLCRLQCHVWANAQHTGFSMKWNFKINVQLNIALILVMKVSRSQNDDCKWNISRWMDEEGAIATITVVIFIAVTLNKQNHQHRLHLDKLGFNFLSYTDMSRIYHKTMSAFKYFTHLLFVKHFSWGRTASYIVRRHIGLIFHYLKWHSIVRATRFFFFFLSFSLYYLFDDIKNIQLK